MQYKYGNRESYDEAARRIKEGLWRVDPEKGFILSNRGISGWHPIGSIRDGYVRVRLGQSGKHVSVHRVMWEYINGTSDLDLTINHIDGDSLNNKIDNLELITLQDNIKDVILRGNGSRNKGSINPMAKLTEKQVSQIKAALEKDVPGRRVAEFFGVKDATISNIKHGVVWSYVEPDYSWNMLVIPSELKPRSVVGSSHFKAKLTDDDIPIIRQRYADGEKPSQIAKDYPVSAATISNIVAGRIWRHVV